ncbi:MAG: PAS domain S-box protein [Haloarculaceae archaeon]
MGERTDLPRTGRDGDARVLVAVDRASNRGLLGDWLAESGYEVCAPDDGLPERFDLCLVDVAAYRRLGDDLDARRAATDSYLPVVLLTSRDPGLDRVTWIDDLLGDAVDDVLTVPVRKRLLAARLRALLRTRDLSLDLARRSHELATARHRLELALQASGQTVWDLDLDETTVSVYGGESLVGLGDGYDAETFRERVHPDDRERLDEARADALAAGAGGNYAVEVRVTHAETGEERWLELSGEVVAEDGSLHVVGTGRDVTERKERERELERSLSLFDQGQRLASIGGWEFYPEANDLYWTDETRRIHGVEPGYQPTVEEAFGFFPEPDRSDLVAAMTAAAEDGEPFDLELQLERADGERRWVHVIGERAFVDDQVVVRGVGQDVTGRVERERDLAESERLFRAVFEESLDAMLLADDDGRYVDANAAACELFGTAYEDLLGRRIDEFAPADYDFETRWASFQTGEQVQGEFPLVRPDGTRRIVEYVATPDVLAGRHLSVVRDVTERVERQHNLERHELVVQTASDPIYTAGPDSRFTMANDALHQYLGGDVVGTTVASAFGDEYAEAVEDCVARLLADGETEGAVETTATFPDGTTRIYQTRVAIKPFDGGYRGYACVNHDVTALREHQRRLTVLDRVLRHNLRNKMNVVLGHATSLVESSDPAIRAAGNAIRDASEELLALGEAARRFQDTIDPQVDATVTADLVAHVRTVVEGATIDHPRATFTADLPASVRARVPESLDLALTEVVENAVVHCDRTDPQVAVSVTTEAETAVVRVTDNGPGISGPTRRALDRGSEGPLEHAPGLGLWLVRWAVAASGGELDIEENDPRGAVVELRFPLATE